jgi:hypothetical protein
MHEQSNPDKPGSSKDPEFFTPRIIEFVGEQVGPVEDDLKAEFCKELRHFPSVLSAYLARLTYDDSPDHSVALCIRSSTGLDPNLQLKLAEVFSSIFRPDQYLDTLFISEDQEKKLELVCHPFYERPNP